MNDASPSPDSLDESMRSFFEGIWRGGDHWRLDSSEFEQAKYGRQLALLEDRRYNRALEIGCGAGSFTRSLSRLSEHIVGLDISPTAIMRARAAESQPGIVYRDANAMDFPVRAEGPWDLTVLSETIYYLGWKYSFFDVFWLASEIFAATGPGGRLLMANTFRGVEDDLLRPALIRSYRDLFVNVGYRIEKEEVFRGTKDEVDIEVLISLFEKRGC